MGDPLSKRIKDGETMYFNFISKLCFRSVRVIDMNQPITIERAQIGRCMYFPQLEWESQIKSHTSIKWKSFRQVFSKMPEQQSL